MRRTFALGFVEVCPSELGNLHLWVMGIFFPRVGRAMCILGAGRSPYMEMVEVVGKPSLKVLPPLRVGGSLATEELHAQRTSILDVWPNWELLLLPRSTHLNAEVMGFWPGSCPWRRVGLL